MDIIVNTVIITLFIVAFILMIREAKHMDDDFYDNID